MIFHIVLKCDFTLEALYTVYICPKIASMDICSDFCSDSAWLTDINYPEFLVTTQVPRQGEMDKAGRLRA